MTHFLNNYYKVKRSFFSEKKYFFLILIISILVLISAYVLEYFFNYPPCKLCLYQRIPYVVLIFLTSNKYGMGVLPHFCLSSELHYSIVFLPKKLLGLLKIKKNGMSVPSGIPYFCLSSTWHVLL